MKFRIVLLIVAALGLAPAASAADLTFTPLKWNGIYGIGEKAVWVVTPAPGATAKPFYTYSIRANGAVEIGKGTLNLTKGSGEISVSLDHPGTIYVAIDRAVPPGPAPDEASKINATLKAVVAKKDPALSIPAKVDNKTA